jgi:hypothetical protein
MTIICGVHSICTPMLLIEVAMLLKANFLQDSGCRLSTRSLVSFLALVGNFLVGLCIRLFLRTQALYSLERHKNQMHVHESHTFLVKVKMVLSRKWAHPKNVTHQISLSEQYVHGNCIGLGTGAVDLAWQLQDVGVELFFTPHKRMHTDVLGFLEHDCDIVPLLLSRVVGKHIEITQSSNDLRVYPLGLFLEQPCRSV